MLIKVTLADAKRFAWEALQNQASSSKAINDGASFTANGDQGDSLFWITVDLLTQNGKIPHVETHIIHQNSVIRTAVRDIFYSALHLDLIIPGQIGQEWNFGSETGRYQFTPKGVEFFRSGTVSISMPGLLVDRVRELVTTGHLDSGIIPLIGEAQKCWMMGCLRASMVLIGLASEGTFMGLIDELRNHPSPPISGTPNWNDWVQMNNEALAFYPRWSSAISILVSIKKELKSAYGKTHPGWWSIWEPFPGGIEPFAQSIRISRNTAAHTVGDIFTSSQVGILLASLPTMLTVISELSAFLNAPPSGVTLPAL